MERGWQLVSPIIMRTASLLIGLGLAVLTGCAPGYAHGGAAGGHLVRVAQAVGWSAATTLRDGVPRWLTDATVAQHQHRPGKAPHHCDIRRLDYWGCLGC